MHTHSDRLERWLGADKVAHVSQAMRDWYGPPIALHGVPGNVLAAKGGDFVGRIRAGSEASAIDRLADIEIRERKRRWARMARAKRALGAIASYDDILAEMTLALQECGRQLSVFLNKRRRDLEAARKRNYMELYIPHLALGLKDILGLPEKEKEKIGVNKGMLDTLTQRIKDLQEV